MTLLTDLLDGAADSPAVTSSLASLSDTDDSSTSPATALRASKPPRVGFCVECADQPATRHCLVCSEEFCDVCCAMLHRTGSRRMHSIDEVGGEDVEMLASQRSMENLRRKGYALLAGGANTLSAATSSVASAASSTMSLDIADIPSTLPLVDLVDATGIIQTGDVSFGDWISERANYIPLRLEASERKLLRLLEAALNVSEYTDKVDVVLYANKTRRIVQQVRDICAILSGLMVACDYKSGQELLQDRDFAQNTAFFQNIFEIGRRHKIMNPEKMRTAYGKLMYMLQDTMQPEVAEALEFSCVRGIKTVYSLLSTRKNGLALLSDPLIATATREVIADGKARRQIQAEIKQKEQAVEKLAKKYGKSHLSFGSPSATDDDLADLTESDVLWCLYSISDNHSYLRSNRDPVDKMIRYLTTTFHPDTASDRRELSLAIAYGKDGARLSHTHSAQYHYVHQTLHLWREIQHEMFMLWYQADQDLLSQECGYRLRDTGQGLNRVQACPGVSREIHRILHRAQKQCGYWIGSSVVHLGDRNVPNALMFIDKYNQVPRILNPIVRCLEQLDEASEKHPALLKYVEHVHGGVDLLRRTILADFFRSAFDGSGADNFFDAGSCIDGRLTSAWNWCAQMEKKAYYPVFLLTGFVGFDGGSFTT